MIRDSEDFDFVRNRGLKDIYRQMAVFDYYARWLVLDIYGDVNYLKKDEDLEEKFSYVLWEKVGITDLQPKEAEEAIKLFGVIHTFLHGDFSTFLKKFPHFERSSNVMIKLGTGEKNPVVPLDLAHRNELNAWRYVLLERQPDVLAEINSAINSLFKIKKIPSANFELISSINPNNPVLGNILNANIGDGSGRIIQYPLSNYIQACERAIRFEIQFRVLTSKIGISTYGELTSTLYNSLSKKFPSTIDLSMIELCIFVRNTIRHISPLKTLINNVYYFRRPSSLIQEAKKQLLANNSIMSGGTIRSDIAKSAMKIDVDYYKNNQPPLIHGMNLLDELICDTSGFHEAFIILDSGLFLIDFLLTRVDIFPI
jgi:hypothetical protein